MENSKINRTIPLFNCIYEIDEHLEFYTALGFDIIYYQKAPYRFATIKNEFTEIGFYGDKNFNPEISGGGCYIVVSNIDEVYEKLKSNLKSHYGKVPSKGVPRISKVNTTAEDRRMNITDPSGNTLIIGEELGESQVLMDAEEEKNKTLSKFEKNYKMAYRYAYSKEDFTAASNLLEYTFKLSDNTKEHDFINFFKAKVLYLDITITLDRMNRAKELIKEIDEIKNVQLDDFLKEELKDEIKRFQELILEI